MKVQKFYNYNDFKQYAASQQFAKHRQFEQDLMAQHAEQDAFKLTGVCKGCDKHATFLIDKQFGGIETEQGWQPNWRERMLCQCELNNRQRAIIHTIKDSISMRRETGQDTIVLYATEQVTPVYQWLVDYFEDVQCIGSEYLGENIPGGTVQDGVMPNMRHEDVENLSFADNSIDIIMSNDVLEHVNQPQKALKEMYRVLKPKGEAFISIPFHVASQTTVRRAEINNGQLQHYLEPAYHGNPISEQGSLVFNDFGWDFLNALHEAGFTEACLCHYWSSLYGYLGEPQYYIHAATY